MHLYEELMEGVEHMCAEASLKALICTEREFKVTHTVTTPILAIAPADWYLPDSDMASMQRNLHNYARQKVRTDRKITLKICQEIDNYADLWKSKLILTVRQPIWDFAGFSRDIFIIDDPLIRNT